MPLAYEIYGVVTSNRGELVLPAVNISQDEDEILQLDGGAVFHDGEWIAFLEPNEYKLYLFADASLGSGSYDLIWAKGSDTPSSDLTVGGNHSIDYEQIEKYDSFPVRRSKIEKGFYLEDDKLVLTLTIRIKPFR